jgi:plastocyanin
MLMVRLVSTAVLLAAAIAGCGGASTTSSSSGGTPSGAAGGAGSAGVSLGSPVERVSATDQLKFTPSSTNAHIGDIVQWTNSGMTAHTVTFEQASSLSDPSLPGGGTWQVKFTQAGTYAYRCTIHSGMTGTIVVT